MRSLLLLFLGSATILCASAALYFGLNGKTMHATAMGTAAVGWGAVTVIAWVDGRRS